MKTVDLRKSAAAAKSKFTGYGVTVLMVLIFLTVWFASLYMLINSPA
ncbi:MAG TPA: hypothetical protein VHK69_02535 [Chitinophagaceae bacterium]|jgi:hypothetical protein|nr:hypothetical protein [Chitinophagaceae bacterium]